MNCWKSINIEKDYGNNRLYLMSALIALSSFIILFVPVSMIHSSESIISEGFFVFILALVSLPALRMLSHLLPMLFLKKPVTFKYSSNQAYVPIPHWVSNRHLSKQLALTVMIMPTVFITIPGLISSLLLPQLFVYTLGLTAVHLGVSLKDFVYIAHIFKAPKTAVIEESPKNMDILVYSTK